MGRHLDSDAAVLDWLGTFASSITYDPASRRWTVFSREPGYPTASGRSLRAAGAEAMRAAMRADVPTTLKMW